jgi:hypothetical protein
MNIVSKKMLRRGFYNREPTENVSVRKLIPKPAIPKCLKNHVE